MDTRTGQLYASVEEATAAGVPPENLKQVDVVTIASGPFKGRKYVRLPDGRLGRRVFDNAKAQQP